MTCALLTGERPPSNVSNGRRLCAHSRTNFLGGKEPSQSRLEWPTGGVTNQLVALRWCSGGGALRDDAAFQCFHTASPTSSYSKWGPYSRSTQLLNQSPQPVPTPSPPHRSFRLYQIQLHRQPSQFKIAPHTEFAFDLVVGVLYGFGADGE